MSKDWGVTSLYSSPSQWKRCRPGPGGLAAWRPGLHVAGAEPLCRPHGLAQLQIAPRLLLEQPRAPHGIGVQAKNHGPPREAYLL